MRDFATEARPLRAHLEPLVLLLPEADIIDQGNGHCAFAVRGKKFAYFLVDHHGDGRIALNVKCAPGVQHDLCTREPHRFHVPAYLGARGWVGYEFEAEPDWDEINEMIRQSYTLLAPKSLVAKMAPPGCP